MSPMTPQPDTNTRRRRLSIVRSQLDRAVVDSTSQGPDAFAAPQPVINPATRCTGQAAGDRRGCQAARSRRCHLPPRAARRVPEQAAWLLQPPRGWLFELGDALLCTQGFGSLPHLSLEAVHQRGWGSAYVQLRPWPAWSLMTSGCHRSGGDHHSGCHQSGSAVDFRSFSPEWARRRGRRNPPDASRAGPRAAARVPRSASQEAHQEADQDRQGHLTGSVNPPTRPLASPARHAAESNHELESCTQIWVLPLC
jgi:hypothetical protein